MQRENHVNQFYSARKKVYLVGSNIKPANFWVLGRHLNKWPSLCFPLKPCDHDSKIKRYSKSRWKNTPPPSEILWYQYSSFLQLNINYIIIHVDLKNISNPTYPITSIDHERKGSGKVSHVQRKFQFYQIDK